MIRSIRIWLPAGKNWALIIHFDIRSLMWWITFSRTGPKMTAEYFSVTVQTLFQILSLGIQSVWWVSRLKSIYLIARHKTTPFWTPPCLGRFGIKTHCSDLFAVYRAHGQKCTMAHKAVSHGVEWVKRVRGKRAKKTTQWEKLITLKLFQSQSLL